MHLGGRLQPRSQARVPVSDAAFRHGEGVFETLRARGERVFRLPEHLRRLRSSAASLGWDLPWTDDHLGRALWETLAGNALPEARVRMQATPGEAGLDRAIGPGRLLVEAVPFVPVEAAVRARGVRLALSPFRRLRGEPSAAKSCSYVVNLLARRRARASGCFEALLLNEAGEVCEAAMANLFAVRDGVLWTPPAAAGPLEGITRATVLEIARREGFEVREEAFDLPALRGAGEVFLTSTGIELLPVVGLDDGPIGGGRPGPRTRHLGEAYRQALDDELGPVAG